MLKKYANAGVISFFVFIAVFFISLIFKINFTQNDDWYYYENVTRFLSSTFTLHPDTAPTFYIQGLFGVVTGIFLGVEFLPFLTALVTLLNARMFYKILTQKLNKSKSVGLIFTLLFVFNPINVYLVLGFMSEQYFMFFLLYSLFFMFQHFETGEIVYLNSSKEAEKVKLENLHKANIFLVLGLFVRQISLAFMLGYSAYFLLLKRWREFKVQIIYFFTALFFYYVIFPQTPEMQSKGLQLQHLLKFDYSSAIIIGTLIYVSAFLVPLLVLPVLNVIKNSIKDKRFIYLGLMFLLSVIFYFGIVIIFNPEAVSWGEFPYFENSYERKGFLPRSIHGDKYHFRGIYDLYLYWDIVAKISLVGYLSKLVLDYVKSRKLIINIEIVLVIVYMGLLLVSHTFYDRYIVFVFPLVLIALVRSFSARWKIPSIIFGVFLVYYAYFFSWDFVLSNSYVFNRSELLIEKGAFPDRICATSSWNEEKQIMAHECAYLFSYDDPGLISHADQQWELIDSKDIVFPGNLFIEPKIFLYKSYSQ